MLKSSSLIPVLNKYPTFFVPHLKNVVLNNCQGAVTYNHVWCDSSKLRLRSSRGPVLTFTAISLHYLNNDARSFSALLNTIRLKVSFLRWLELQNMYAFIVSNWWLNVTSKIKQNSKCNLHIRILCCALCDISLSDQLLKKIFRRQTFFVLHFEVPRITRKKRK